MRPGLEAFHQTRTNKQARRTNRTRTMGQALVGPCTPCSCVERSSSSFPPAICSSDFSSEYGCTLPFSQLDYFSLSSVQHPALRSVLKTTGSVCIPHLLPPQISKIPSLTPLSLV